MIAKVEWYVKERQYGFLQYASPSGDGEIQRVFVHRNQLINTEFLKRDWMVSFELGKYRNRVCAVQVKVISGDDVAVARPSEQEGAHERQTARQ